VKDAHSFPHRDRMRRVMLLCCSFVQNMAFYRAAVADRTARILSDHHPEAAFLRRAINNFLDVAVLDWCKLFGSQRSEKHHWRRVVSDAARFERALFRELGTNAAAFEELVGKILYYRNRFLAHLDDDLLMDIPELDPARKAVVFYHRHIIEHEARPGELAGLPNADAFARGFAQCTDEAIRAYRKLGDLS
jgi:hypothetical protein